MGSKTGETSGINATAGVQARPPAQCGQSFCGSGVAGAGASWHGGATVACDASPGQSAA